MKALYKGFRGAAIISIVLIAVTTLLFLGPNTVYRAAARAFTGWGAVHLRLVGLAGHGAIMWITEYYTARPSPGAEDRRGLDHRPRHQHHPGPRGLDGGHRAAGAGDLRRHPRSPTSRRASTASASPPPPCWR
jgi:hypothetical protein